MKLSLLYYVAVAVLSMIVFVSALALAMGYTMSAPTWWERYIEMPIYATIAIIVFVVSAYKAMKVATK